MIIVALFFTVPQAAFLMTGAEMLIQQTASDPELPFWAALLINTGILTTIVGVVGYMLKKSMDTRFETQKTEQAEATKESNMVTAIGQLATSLTESTRAFAIEMQKERATMIEVIRDNTDAKVKLASEVNTTTLNLEALNASVNEMKAEQKQFYDRLARLFPRDDQSAKAVIEEIMVDALKDVCREKRQTDEHKLVEAVGEPLPDIQPPAPDQQQKAV